MSERCMPPRQPGSPVAARRKFDSHRLSLMATHDPSLRDSFRSQRPPLSKDADPRALADSPSGECMSPLSKKAPLHQRSPKTFAAPCSAASSPSPSPIARMMTSCPPGRQGSSSPRVLLGPLSTDHAHVLQLAQFVHSLNVTLADKEAKLSRREVLVTHREQRLAEAEQRLIDWERQLSL
eukprot:gene11729-18086_t